MKFLLDTGMLVGFVRKAPWYLWAKSEFNLGGPEATVFTSVICQGEILALAEKLDWGTNRKNDLKKIMSDFSALDIGKQPVLNAYAMIDAWTRGCDTHPDQLPPPKSVLPMAQNDLWIAATAYESKATLISTDKGFNRLKDVWIDFVYVDQKMRLQEN